LYPQWAVGFAEPFAEKIGCRFESDTIVEVTGQSDEAAILRDMLVGGRLIELGSHEELLAQGGRYAELFQLQARGYQ